MWSVHNRNTREGPVASDCVVLLSVNRGITKCTECWNTGTWEYTIRNQNTDIPQPHSSASSQRYNGLFWLLLFLEVVLAKIEKNFNRARMTALLCLLWQQSWQLADSNAISWLKGFNAKTKVKTSYKKWIGTILWKAEHRYMTCSYVNESVV